MAKAKTTEATAPLTPATVQPEPTQVPSTEAAGTPTVALDGEAANVDTTLITSDVPKESETGDLVTNDSGLTDNEEEEEETDDEEADETPKKEPFDLLESLETDPDLEELKILQIKFSNGETFEAPMQLVIESVSANFETALKHSENYEGKSEFNILEEWIKNHMSWFDFEKEAKLVSAKAANHFDYADNFLRAEFSFQ